MGGKSAVDLGRDRDRLHRRGDRRLTVEGESDREPDLSPDGRTLVFRRGVDRIYSAARDGSGLLEIARGYNPRFSPDGRRIAWWNERGVFAAEQLIALGKRTPVWISAESLLVEGGGWWIGGLDGKMRRIGDARGAAQFVKDGEIYYVDNGALWRVAMAGGDPARVAEHRTGIATARESGGTLILSTLPRSIDAWSLPMDGDTFAVRGPPARLTDAGDARLPVLSGDGRKLAYISSRSGKPDVWVRDLRSGREDRITPRSMPRYRPVLSHDGAMIALSLDEADGCRVTISSTVVFTRTATIEQCVDVWDWSPDGRRLLVGAAGAAKRDLEVASPDGRRVIYKDATRDVAFARMAPSGRWLAMTIGEPRRTFISPMPTAMALDEMSISEIPGSTGGVPAWSPNGQAIYFRSERGGSAGIWAQRLDARRQPRGAAIRIIQFGSSEFSIDGVGDASFHMSVSRERLVFNAVTQRGEIWKTALR